MCQFPTAKGRADLYTKNIDKLSLFENIMGLIYLTILMLRFLAVLDFLKEKLAVCTNDIDFINNMSSKQIRYWLFLYTTSYPIAVFLMRIILRLHMTQFAADFETKIADAFRGIAGNSVDDENGDQ